MSFQRFTRLLLQRIPLDEIPLALPHRRETVYAWRNATPYEVALGAKAGSYFCHYTAMVLHELTTQVPKVIYVNVEQRPHVPNPQSLTQEAIDRAFRVPQRTTRNTVEYEAYRLVYINGRHTGQLGVVDFTQSNGRAVRVTGIERTLIDIAVRPAYAGGVGEVASAYATALPKIAVGRLATMLEGMDFVYPYEQAIGFYLERAGCPEVDLQPFRRRPMTFDFHLMYGAKQTDYVPSWRLHVPKGFQVRRNSDDKVKVPTKIE